MSCFACNKNYGFFCKEVGCPNCGFSFCTKCLKCEIEVIKLNNKKCKVCLKCFEILSKFKKERESQEAENSKVSLADSQIFAITEPFSAPILEPIQSAEEALEFGKADNEDNLIKQNLDVEINKRLAGLKTNIPFTSDKDIAERLASLKDTTYTEHDNKDILLSKDTRTDQEKIKDLLTQFVEENNIDNKINNTKDDSIADIEKRLAALRGSDISAIKNNSIQIPKDESMNVNKIIQKYLDEAKLPDFSNSDLEIINNVEPRNADLEELPFCIICNEDAVTRCLDCDNDLYCRNCFKEIHNNEEYRLHQTICYTIPPKFKENHF